MSEHQNPDARPGVARTDSEAAADERAMYDYLDVANRTLQVVLGMHELGPQRPGEIQVGLVVMSDSESRAPDARDGVRAHVVFVVPGVGEHTFSCWAPHWRAAIELAIYEAIHI